MTAQIENAVIRLGEHIALQILTAEGYFQGFGTITADDIVLRHGERPMFVQLRTPNAELLCNYRLSERDEMADGGLMLTFTMDVVADGMKEWMPHEVRNLYNTANWARGPVPATDTMLQVELHPVTRIIDGHTLHGFSYQYHYASASLPMYRILDRATWEIGGAAVGNELWFRNGIAPSIFPIDSKDQHYSTEWYIPNCQNPTGFQYHPLQTQFQGFVMTAHASGILVQRPTKLAHIRTLLEKHRDEDVIAHWHEHCDDLANTLSTSPVEVLWLPGEFSRTARANIYHSLFEMVAESLHAQAGMQRDRVGTYCVLEEWGLPNFSRYNDEILPKILETNVKTIYIPNQFENNMNVWGVSNFCCTVDYRVADSVGAENLRRFCQLAHSKGARVEMWGNTSLSTLTTILNYDGIGQTGRVKFLPVEGTIREVIRKAKTPFVRNMSNAIEADHYTPVFACLNLRDPDIRDYWMRCWTSAHDDIGIDGIFLDSSFNLSSDKFHYEQLAQAGSAGALLDQASLHGFSRPAVEPPQAILTQYHAHLSLMAAMQQVGYHYTGEDVGVFGIHRSGPDVTQRVGAFFLWPDSLLQFDVKALKALGLDPDAVFFQGLAYRMMWFLQWNIAQNTASFHYGSIRDEDDRPNDWHYTLLRVYDEVEPLLTRRDILPDEVGVRYRHDDTTVVWAFADCALPLDVNSHVESILDGGVTLTDVLHARRHQVYRIRPALN